MNRSGIVSIVTLITLALTLTAGAKEIKWKAQTSFPPMDSGTIHQAQGMVKATNAALKGRLSTTFFQVGQIVPEGEMGPALSHGVIDAAYMPPMARTEAGNIAFGLPFSWDSFEDVMAFYYDFGFLEWFRKHEEKYNIFVGCPLPWGPVTLFSNFPVNKLEDYKGKKIWAWGLMASVIEAFGAKPVMFDPGEVYMALKLGTIDGVLWGPAELETVKIKEVVKYISLPAIIDPLVFDWSMNMKSWKKLSPETQQTYLKTMKANIRPMYDRIAVENNIGFKKAAEYGVKTIHLSPEEAKRLKTVARKAWEIQAAKNPANAEAVAMLKEFLAQRGK